ncbi:unnamed protein product [Cylicostephanus goldi]|uniref:Fibronectin type-III domain-containing protein n=1 Tax=Cylicostephanus goldi TaxID=71465 RepID=A0A3P7PTM0_CYLGO|nr:unnamed protein product [Cylicostephanus goldi]
MKILIYLIVITSTATAFTVLPYIQIDYAHYFRLAQCQAKCTQKYGILSSRVLLDGSLEEFLDTQNADCKACESGCHQHRRSHGRGPPHHGKTPTDDGLKFWGESKADTAKVGSTLVSSVQLLCQNPSIDEEFGESSEGLVSISLLRSAGPTRFACNIQSSQHSKSATVGFVVQWKQRTQAMGYYDETQWITASVESDTLLKIKGLIPGVQYRFKVTAVGPSGRLGEAVDSTWTEISSSGAPRTPGSSLIIRNGYDSDRGVTAHLEWLRNPQESCYYNIQLSNATSVISTDIRLDGSSSILLPHLEFDCDYVVTLAATTNDKTQTSGTVTSSFKSLQCKDVHGRGSLQCCEYRKIYSFSENFFFGSSVYTDCRFLYFYQFSRL